MQGIIGNVWDCIPHPAPNNHSTEIGESLLFACPAFCCRSLRKLFLPDSIRRSGFPWCAPVMAALPRKVIVACSWLFGCQGTRVFNHRIGESPFRKVLSKFLQIFCFLTNRNPQGRFHIQFFEIFKNSHRPTRQSIVAGRWISSSQSAETDGSAWGYGEQNPHQDARHEKPKWNFELLRANLALINVQAVIFGESSVSIEIAGFHHCTSVFLRSEDTGWHGQ